LEFTLKPLPSVLRAANVVGRAFPGRGDSLHPDRLLSDAARVASLPPAFPAHVREALDVLHASIQSEVRLHWFGAANLRELLVTGLAALLRVEKMFADDPSLAATPLGTPVFVTGLPRSGTTFLHRLLSASPDAIGVPLHGHFFPAKHGALDLRRAETHLKFYPWRMAGRAYDLDAIHFMRPDLPDECNFGMRLAVRSMIYWGVQPAHSYLRWLLAQDLRESYQLYRKVLILHQRANPGRRLTLKCPHHMAWLPALAEALPEAVIVETHRDPVEVVASDSKLILATQGTSTDEIDWRRTVESNRHKIRTYARRAIEASDSPLGLRIHHVDYRRLVRDPVAVARDLHQRAGLPFSAAHEATLAEFSADNRQHKHGKNHYRAADYGLDPSEIAREYADYRERFIAPGV